MLTSRIHRPFALAVIGALAVTTSLAACGSNGSDGASGDDGSDTDTTLASTLPEGAEDLEGRYAHFDVVSYEGDLMRTVIISTGFADLEMRDGELWNVQRFCHADTATDIGGTTTMADAATQAIVPVDTPVIVTEEDGKLRVQRPATPTAIGIDLEDPANDVLPTDPDDPRITDDDGDGNPGVTATVDVSDALSGEVYLARREIFAYDVTQVSDDRLEGTITDGSEQLIVGATDPLFLTDDEWVQIDDVERNPVIWIRVDDDWDCERLAAERDELFPPNPEADW